jgi:hypothetical protein
MKLRILLILFAVCALNSCVSIPKETVQLSKAIGEDLKTLQSSHIAMVDLFYIEITRNINSFIADVYAPYIIHYVLKKEKENYNNQKQSIFGAIENAGKDTAGKTETDEAFNEMTDFLTFANTTIKKKRDELLNPIQKQQDSIIREINRSYKNTMYANSAIINYLESALKVKESQKQVLSIVGLKGKDEELNNTLLKVSSYTKSLLEKGKEIDIKSDKAKDQMKILLNEIKTTINKK